MVTLTPDRQGEVEEDMDRPFPHLMELPHSEDLRSEAVVADTRVEVKILSFYDPKAIKAY